jgi:hypothetical protein
MGVLKRLALLLAALAFPAAAHADGCPPSSCGAATVAVPGASTLAVRSEGSDGPVVVYDLRAGKRAFELPAGVLSADGRRHVVARAGKRSTTVRRYDARTGRLLGARSIPGRWWLNAVSANGSRLVLAEIVAGRRKTTRLAVADGSGRVGRIVALSGMLEAEAVSADGRRLFLVQWLRRGYVVRGYDVGARRLTTIRAGGDPAIMRGTAWGSVASPDGRWLLTLYLEPDGETAIHALDVRRGRAACIDLPATSFENGREYGFVLAGETALAVNPRLGLLARVDLARDRVVATTRFRPVREPTAGLGSTFGTIGAATARRAVFAYGRSVWTYDRRSGAVTGPRDAGEPLVGLAFTPDVGSVRAVRADGRIVSLGD